MIGQKENLIYTRNIFNKIKKKDNWIFIFILLFFYLCLAKANALSSAPSLSWALARFKYASALILGESHSSEMQSWRWPNSTLSLKKKLIYSLVRVGT